MSVLKKLGLFVALALAANLVTVALLPQAINRLVMHKIVAQALERTPGGTIAGRGGYNVALPAPRADASSRTVVRPSPDLLYTACVFDLSEHALHITGPVADSYVSVAGFAADTHNFFAANDSALEPGTDGHKHFDLVIARSAVPVPEGSRLILAPSDRGLILFRSLIGSDADLPRLREVQSQQACNPL